MKYSYADVAQMIDHSLLKPNLSAADLEAGCRLALEYQVASVCVLPYYLLQAVRLLRGSPVIPTTTIGFPHGGQTAPVKLAEAKQAIDDGARELDMVEHQRGAEWRMGLCSQRYRLRQLRRPLRRLQGKSDF